MFYRYGMGCKLCVLNAVMVTLFDPLWRIISILNLAAQKRDILA